MTQSTDNPLSFTLEELAYLSNASVFHFSRPFTASFGRPPFAYQRNLLVQKAKELLSATELSIRAVAIAVGMEDSKSFTRVFHRLTGLALRAFFKETKRDCEIGDWCLV